MGAGLELEAFSSRFRRDRVTNSDTVFDVEICRFADVPHDLITSVALGYTAGQCRHGGDVSAVRFPLKDDRIAQWSLALDSDHTSEHGPMSLAWRLSWGAPLTWLAYHGRNPRGQAEDSIP